MDIKNSPIVKHAINNDKSLLPGIIAYSSKQLCEEENIPWEQIRAATGDSIDNYMS